MALRENSALRVSMIDGEIFSDILMTSCIRHQTESCGSHTLFSFQFISIHVRNPRTHLVHGWPVFTDYEIAVRVSSRNN